MLTTSQKNTHPKMFNDFRATDERAINPDLPNF